jgi:hypothetical protein
VSASPSSSRGKQAGVGKLSLDRGIRNSLRPLPSHEGWRKSRTDATLQQRNRVVGLAQSHF